MMVDLVHEREDELEEVESEEEETQRKKKKKRSTETSNAGETSSSKPHKKGATRDMPKKTGRSRDAVWVHVDVLKDKRLRCKYCKKKYSGGASRIKAHLQLEGNKGGIAPCRKRPPPSVLEVTDTATTATSSPEIETQSHPNPSVPPSPISPHPECDANPTAPLSPSAPYLECDPNPAAPLSPSPLGPQDDPNSDVPSSPSPPHPQDHPDHVVPLSTNPSCPQETTDLKAYYEGLVKHLVANNVPFPSKYLTPFKGSPLSLKTEVDQYKQMVKESWSTTGYTLKIHFKEKIYDDLPEESEVVGCTIYSPKGVIFLNWKQFQDEVEKVKKEATQLLCDLEHRNDAEDTLYLYAGATVITEWYEDKSICATTEILELLRRISEGCDWIRDLFKDVERGYKNLTQRDKNPSTASKFEDPFSKLQVILQKKEELGSDFLDGSETSRNKFWEVGKELFNAVEPLIQILTLFDSFVPNIGYFYGAIKKAEKRIEFHYKANQEKFTALWELFKGLKHCVIWPIHVRAAYLNPDFMYNELIIEDKMNEEIKEDMKELLARSKEEEETLENEMAKYNKKDLSLFTDEAKSMFKECHPVAWWEKFGGTVPMLKQYAIRLLSQPSNCLSHLYHSPKFEEVKFEDVDLLRLNATMMEEFKKLEEKDLIFKPIDLSKIDEP